MVAWDVDVRENAAIADDLVSRACLSERVSESRKQPLILNADNGNALRAATLESRLRELGVLRSFSRTTVSNDNPYSESLFRTAKYRPEYPRKPFASKDQACQWVASFVDWYNEQQRHSGIKFVMPPAISLQSGRRDLPAPCCRLRTGPTTQYTAVVTNDPLLASARNGLDQSTASRN